MKRLLILLLGFSFLKGQAQAPQQINYQGIARNSVGSVIANQNISMHDRYCEIQISTRLRIAGS